jgi:hypothetical protein
MENTQLTKVPHKGTGALYTKVVSLPANKFRFRNELCI